MLIDHEARQAQALTGLAAQDEDRVYMARQYRVCAVGLRLVLQGKGLQNPRLVHDLNIERGWWIAGVAIMIAAYEHHFQIFVPLSPILHLGQRCRGAGRAGMQKVAQDDQLFAVMLGQQAIEPGECRLSRSAWHRLMQGAVAGGLSDVHVGHQQGAAGGPVDGFVGKQPERLPRCSMGW